MPFVMKGDAQTGGSTSGTQATTLVGKDNGGENLTVVNAAIDPGAGLALHVHPGYEEVTLVVEGNIEAILEGETRTLGPGDVMLAPAGAKHTITNQSDKPAKVLAIYPTTTPERVFVEPA
jgi:quercetin dioxygenase-like cupin family protein